MCTQYFTFIVALVLGFAIALMLAISIWQRRSSPGAIPLLIFALALCEWTLTYAYSLITPDLASRVFWSNAAFLGIVCVPSSWLCFALDYAGRLGWRKRWYRWLLGVMPIVTLGFVGTNHLHGLFRQQATLVQVGACWDMSVVMGPAFWGHLAYSYLLVAAGTAIFLPTLNRASLLRRWQGQAMLMGAILPWVSNIIYIFGSGNALPGLDITPLAFTGSCVIFAWNLKRYGLFEILPIARDQIIDSMQDALIVLDTQNRIVDVNPAMLRLLRSRSEQLVGKPLELAHADLRILLTKPAELEPTVWEVELFVENELRHFEVQSFPLYKLRYARKRRNIQGRAILLRDISDRKQIAAELIAARDRAEAANRAKSAFVANISHEFRTPLNAILGFSELMRNDTSRISQHQDYLDTIYQAGEHLLELVNDVLSISKIEAGQLEYNETCFDLHQLLTSLDHIFRLRAETKGLLFKVMVAQDVPTVIKTDEGKVRQVLANLLSNAIKFTQTGHVILRVYRQAPFPTSSDSSPTADSADSERPSHCWIRFTVEDTGTGIQISELSSLFQAFSQTESGRQSKEGTGLGLAISQALLGLMGGSITVQSTFGVGSTFTCIIPVKGAIAAELSLPTTESNTALALAPGQPDYRILVADDNRPSRQVLVVGLQQAGFAVREAENGEVAVRLCREWQPHLIWMDVRMPILDGVKATQQIKAESPSTIVIALTASAFDEERTYILSSGCDDIVLKPVHLSTIFKTLHRFLGVRYTSVTPTSPHAATQSAAPNESHSQPSSTSRPAALHLTQSEDKAVLTEPAPTHTAKHSPLSAVAAPSPQSAQPIAHILIADDSPFNRKLMLSFCQRLNCTAQAVNNGREVLEAVRQTRFDIALLDLQMPEMDGLEAAANLVDQFAPSERPIIIAVTGNDDDETRERCAAVGMQGYLCKPCTLDSVRQIIYQWMSPDLQADHR